jgi:integrase
VEVSALLSLPDIEPRARCAFILGTFAGLRLGEARGLRLEDVDEAAGFIEIRSNFVSGTSRAPKCGSTRAVPAPKVVFDAIRHCSEICVQKSRGEFVLWNSVSRTSPCSAQFLEKHFREALTAIGIDDEAREERGLTFHSTRHTFVSLARAAGVPDYVVAKLAGHTSLKTTERYEHGNSIDFAEARRKIESFTGVFSPDTTADKIVALEAELATLKNSREAQS